MKHLFVKPIASAVLLCAAAQANAQTEADTVVNVVDPTRVIVTESGDETTVEIEGTATNPNYHLLYSVSSDTTSSQAPSISLPFIGDRKQPGVRSQVTLCNDIYFCAVMPYHAPQAVRTSYETGIGNVIGYRYNFGPSGASLGFGLGFATKVLILRRGLMPHRIGDAFVLVPAPEGSENVHGKLSVWNLQLPLYYRQRIYRSWAVQLSAVLDYNVSAKAHSNYRIGNTSYHREVKGLHQRLITPEFVLSAGCVDDFSIMLRWSPVSVFKSAYGPRISTYSLGISLAF